MFSSAFKIFFFSGLKQFNYTLHWQFSSCFLFLGLLGILDVWVHNFNQIWKLFDCYFFQFFFLSPALGESKLHIELVAQSFHTAYWCSFHFLCVFCSLSVSFCFSSSSLVSFAISNLLLNPSSVFSSQTL